MEDSWPGCGTFSVAPTRIRICCELKQFYYLMLELEANDVNIALAMILMDEVRSTWRELLDTYPF